MNPSRSRSYLLQIILLLAYVNIALLIGNRLDFRSTPLFDAGKAYRLPTHTDSWYTMNQAYAHIRAHPEVPVYSELFFRWKVKFQYPVSSLLVLAPLGAAGADPQALYRSFTVLSQLSLAVLLSACGMLAVSLLNRGSPDGEFLTSRKRWSVVAATALLVSTFYPVYKAYNLGQIQLWLDALIAVAFWCYWSGFRRWTGVLVGLMALIKPQYGLFLIWAALRRQWGVTTGFLGAFALGSIASLALFGWENNVQYFSVLSYLSLHGESYFPNQSVNGLMNRLLENGPNLVFLQHGFPDFHPLVYAVTMATSVFMVAGSLYFPLRWRGGGSVVDFSILLLTCTMASPIAWEHHYGVLVPILIFLFTRLGRFRPMERVALGVSFFAVAANHSWTNRFADGWYCILQSYLFFGALCILVLLYRCACRDKEEGVLPSSMPSVVAPGMAAR
jgi:hypothetical protein